VAREWELHPTVCLIEPALACGAIRTEKFRVEACMACPERLPKLADVFTKGCVGVQSH